MAKTTREKTHQTRNQEITPAEDGILALLEDNMASPDKMPAGHVTYSDEDRSEAFIFDGIGWCEAITMRRGDCSQEDFERRVELIAAVFKIS